MSDLTPAPPEGAAAPPSVAVFDIDGVLADVRHLCDQRSIDFNLADKAAFAAYSTDRVEARK